jgi:hypothetical protein
MCVHSLKAMRQVIYVRKNNNIIEINGQRYDATSGAVLKRYPPNNAKPAAPGTIRQSAKHSPSHKPAPSNTLMRQAVRKPGPGLKRRFKAQGDTDSLARQALDSIVANASLRRLDIKRLQDAKKVAKSQFVSHFSPTTAAVSYTPPTTPPKPNVAAPAVHTLAGPAKRPKTTADLLERAVQQATSHREPPPERTRHNRAKRNAGIGAAVVLSVLLLVVVVAQNLSNVRLQMASAKAGFSAGLPAYQPAGYSLGQLNYSDGVVAAQFHSNSDGRGYTITQKRSSLDSGSLRDGFVAPADAHYQEAEAGGLTIYLYGNRNATWVNGGIWYVVQANGSFSDRQLIELATSL